MGTQRAVKPQWPSASQLFAELSLAVLYLSSRAPLLFSIEQRVTVEWNFPIFKYKSVEPVYIYFVVTNQRTCCNIIISFCSHQPVFLLFWNKIERYFASFKKFKTYSVMTIIIKTFLLESKFEVGSGKYFYEGSISSYK